MAKSRPTSIQDDRNTYGEKSRSEGLSYLVCFLLVLCVTLSSLVPLAFYKIYHLERMMVSKTELQTILEQHEKTDNIEQEDTNISLMVRHFMIQRLSF